MKRLDSPSTPGIFISDRQILTESETDKQFKLLKHTILNVWPECLRDCPCQIIEFWNHRDELSVTKGILPKGKEVLITYSLRAKILECIHKGQRVLKIKTEGTLISILAQYLAPS